MNFLWSKIPSRVVALLLIFLMSAALATTTAAIRIFEDVDSDGRVDVCDLNVVINVILNLCQVEAVDIKY